MRKERAYGIIPFRKFESQWHVLLVQHAKGEYWGFPKGHDEEGELPLETAQRELREETGLQVEKFLLAAPLEEKYTFFRNEEEIEKFVSYFPAVVSGELRTQAIEILEGKWVALEKVDQVLTFQESKESFHEALRHLKTFFYPHA